MSWRFVLCQRMNFTASFSICLARFAASAAFYIQFGFCVTSNPQFCIELSNWSSVERLFKEFRRCQWTSKPTTGVCFRCAVLGNFVEFFRVDIFDQSVFIVRLQRPWSAMRRILSEKCPSLCGEAHHCCKSNLFCNVRGFVRPRIS